MQGEVTFVPLTKYYDRKQTKEDETGGARENDGGGVEKCIQGFCVEVCRQEINWKT